MEEKIIHKVIREICEELNIDFKLLSRDWIIKLEKNNKIRFVSGYKFDLNTHAIGEIIDDKYGLYEILKDENIPIIEHNIIYSKDNNSDFAIGYNDYNIVKEYFKTHNNSIVIKPNKGTCGKGVYHIENIDDIEPTLELLFNKNYSLSYCPFYDIRKEYRIIVLNNEVKLIYQKERPVIKGNGINTIKELLIDFNKNYFIDKELDEEYDRVLNKNELFEYSWKFNLSKGSVSSIVTDKELIKKLTDITSRILSKYNMKFVSIDVIDTDNKLLIMEINSGVMMKNIYYQLGEKIVKDIYKEAIIELFK